MSVRSVSHVVADFMVTGNKSSLVSLRCMLFRKCCNFGQIFDSKRVLEIHGTATCPSVLQVCTPTAPSRPAVDDVNLWRTMFARSVGNEIPGP